MNVIVSVPLDHLGQAVFGVIGEGLARALGQVSVGVALLPAGRYLFISKQIDDTMRPYDFPITHDFNAFVLRCSLQKPQEQVS